MEVQRQSLRFMKFPRVETEEIPKSPKETQLRMKDVNNKKQKHKEPRVLAIEVQYQSGYTFF